jgi:branched-chain amino acid transport system permease protein
VEIFLQQLFNGVVLASAYALVAVGLTLLFGILDIVNFAHGEFYMAGAYIALFLTNIIGTSLIPVLLLTIVLAALLGLVIERVALRPLLGTRPTNFILSTLGLSIILQEVVRLIFDPQPKRLPVAYIDRIFVLGGVTMDSRRIVVILVSMALVLGLQLFISRTQVGLAMRAMAEDHLTARLMGVSVPKIAMVTVAGSFSLAATAGILLGSIYLLQPTMGSTVIMKAFAAIVLGGMGNITGAVLGAGVIGISESMTAAYISSGVKDVVSFMLLILVLLYRPQGLLSRGDW